MTFPLPRISVTTALLLVSGCVTINIYFPAAAAEKAADKIIDEVWQIQKDKESAKKAEPSSSQPKQ